MIYKICMCAMVKSRGFQCCRGQILLVNLGNHRTFSKIRLRANSFFLSIFKPTTTNPFF